MSQIRIFAPDPDSPFAADVTRPTEVAGTFDTDTSQFWCGDGGPRRQEIIPDTPGLPGEYATHDRENERLWYTADGRWVITNGPIANQLTDEQAEQWFTDNGYTAEDRAFVRSGRPSSDPQEGAGDGK